MYNLNHPTIKYIKTYINAFPPEQHGAFYNGPAHIALDDYNLSDGNIEWCMKHTEEWLKQPDKISEYPAFKNFTVGECIRLLGDVYVLLEFLLYIPEEKREVHQGPWTLT